MVRQPPNEAPGFCFSSERLTQAIIALRRSAESSTPGRTEQDPERYVQGYIVGKEVLGRRKVAQHRLVHDAHFDLLRT